MAESTCNLGLLFVQKVQVTVSIPITSSNRSMDAKEVQVKLSNTQIIIDCYEIECQRPSSLLNLSVTCSQYKSRNT